MQKKQKNNLEFNKGVLIASILLVVYIPFTYISSEITPTSYLGFPIDWLTLYYSNNRYSFNFLGFILDVLFFYFVIVLVIKIVKMIKKKK